jgi:hypothetical protein
MTSHDRAQSGLMQNARTLVATCLLALIALLVPAAARAQVTYAGTGTSVNLGAVALGASSSTVAVSVTVQANTDLSLWAALTGGVPFMDFEEPGTSDTCIPSSSVPTTCVIHINFTPSAPGLRQGALVFYDSGGNTIGSVGLYGTGTGPQIAFDPPNPAPQPLVATANLYTTLADPNDDVLVVSNRDSAGDLNSGSVVGYTNTGDGAVYTAPTSIATGLSYLTGATLDGAGNIFVASYGDSSNDANSGLVYEIPRNNFSYGYGTPVTIATGLSAVYGLAIDASGNLFFESAFDSSASPDSGYVSEIPLTSSGYGTPTTVASAISQPVGLAIDANGNLFVASYADSADDNLSGQILEIPLAGASYGAAKSILTGQPYPEGIAIEPNGNILFTTEANPAFTDKTGTIVEIPLTPSGYGTAVPFATGLSFPISLAIDPSGNFLLNTNTTELAEIVRFQPTLTFANTGYETTSPDSPQVTRVENIGNAALSFSQVDFPTDFPEGANTTDCTHSTVLASTATCTFTVDFKPVTSPGSTAGNSQLLTEYIGTRSYTLGTPATPQVIIATGTVFTRYTPSVSVTAASPGVLGTADTFTATVTGVNSIAAPTGPVAFYLGAQLLGAAIIAGGKATFTTTLPAAGAYQFNAFYGGDTNYMSASGHYSGTSAKATPAVGVSAASNPGTLGATDSITVTLTGITGAATPTGSVTISYLGVPLKTIGLVSGSASYGAVLPVVGAFTIGVTYNGDTNYSTASAPPYTVTVNQATPTVAVTATPSTITSGSSVALKATLTGASATGVPAPTGTVTFTTGTTILCSKVAIAAGSASCTTTALPIGTGIVVTATYSGDGNYLTATGTNTASVNKATPAITWATPAAITYGTALSATQLDASSKVAGSFTYSSPLGTVLTGGAHTVTATFKPANTTAYATATASVTITVNKATPAVTWAKPAAITYGTALSATQLDATSKVAGAFVYSPTSGTVLAVGTPTLSVTFTPTATTDYTTAKATVTLTVNPAPSFSVSASPASLTVAQGASGKSTITVTKQNGFAGKVTLAASGLRSGVTAAFATNPTTGTSVLTLTASKSATTGTSSVTVKGTSGSLTASKTIALTVDK